MSVSETKDFKIAGFKVECEKQPYDSTGDRPIKATFHAKTDNEITRLLANYVENQVEETTASDSIRQTNNVVTFHNVYAGAHPEKEAADFEGVCGILEDLSKQFPTKIGLHELQSKLQRLRKMQPAGRAER